MSNKKPNKTTLSSKKGYLDRHLTSQASHDETSLYSNNARAYLDPQNVPKPPQSTTIKKLNIKAIINIQKHAKAWL